MDSSNQGLEANLVEECSCSICMELYNDPVQLPCHHSFCKDCLADYASTIHSPNLPCPLCKSIHVLAHSGDISKFPTDLFAKRIVSHLQSSRRAENSMDPSLSLSSALTASDSGSRMKGEESLDVSPSGPPLEPRSMSIDSESSPKVPLQPVEEPRSLWSYLSYFLGSSSSAPQEPEQQASSSAAPSSISASTSSTPNLVSNLPLQLSTYPVTPHFSSAPVASSSNESQNDMALSSAPPLAFSSSNIASPSAPLASSLAHSAPAALGISKAKFGQRRSNLLVPMPPRLLPPRHVLLEGCSPQLETEEIYMPFIVREDSLPKKFNKWVRSLWFAKVDEARFLDSAAMLIPAWRLEGELTIQYEATAVSRPKRQKGREGETKHRVKQSGTLRIPQYSTIVAAVDKEFPFKKLLWQCKLTDQLPLKYQPGIFQGEHDGNRFMDELAEPEGVLVDRDADWYRVWRKFIKHPMSSIHPFVDLITNAIRSQDGLQGPNVKVKVSSVSIAGFSSLTLSPLRIPIYLCRYSVPQDSNPYHLLVNGQDGTFHDGGKRPLSSLGGLVKFFFGPFGAFSK